MPSGKIHSATTAAIPFLAASGSLLWQWSKPYEWQSATAFLVGTYTGFLLGPDLDVDAGNISAYYLRQLKIVGPLLSSLWKLYWLPYAKICGHRGFLSHFPFVSTVIRLIYFGWPFVAFILFTKEASIIEAPNFWQYFLFWFLGLLHSDVMHWWLDQFSRDKQI